MFHVLAHLMADRHEGVKEFLIGRLNIRTEKLHHSDHFMVSDDGKSRTGN